MCSTMQDILLQKSTESKIQGRKIFTWRQKSSSVTRLSKHEFGPRPIMEQYPKLLPLCDRSAPATSPSIAYSLNTLK